MTPLHAVLPELAQREVRCVHIGPGLDSEGGPSLPADEYAYLEHYCEDLNCDCRRVFLQVIAKNQPGKVFASISYGWEREEFYRKKMAWDPDGARGTVRGELDPINEQSEFAEDFLELFQNVVLDEPYRLRLRRHSQLFREELARKKQKAESRKQKSSRKNKQPEKQKANGRKFRVRGPDFCFSGAEPRINANTSGFRVQWSRDRFLLFAFCFSGGGPIWP